VLATLAVSAAFGYFAVRGIKFSATWGALHESNYWWLVPALGALAASILLRVVRWQTLFDPGRRPPLGSLAKATIVGFFFNSILPARTGEIARIVALKKYAGTSRAETTATVVVERLFDVSSLIVLLFVLLPWLPHVSWLRPAAIVALACLAAILALIVSARLLSKRPRPLGGGLLARIPGLSEETVRRLTGNVVHGLSTLRRPRQALAVLGWTFLSWLLLGLSFWFLMVGFDLGLSPVAGLLVVVANRARIHHSRGARGSGRVRSRRSRRDLGLRNPALTGARVRPGSPRPELRTLHPCGLAHSCCRCENSTNLDRLARTTTISRLMVLLLQTGAVVLAGSVAAVAWSSAKATPTAVARAIVVLALAFGYVAFWGEVWQTGSSLIS
jgi:uncharacterized protein (TIRG00374 family)